MGIHSGKVRNTSIILSWNNIDVIFMIGKVLMGDNVSLYSVRIILALRNYILSYSI